MVFETLRVGFPTAEVTVYWKGLDKSPEWKAVGDACQKAEVQHFLSIPEVSHADWIARVVEESQGPFYLCDTDMVFWKSFEGFSFGEAPLAGRFIPQFFDKFTQCATRPRLHTALLYIDPARVISETEKYFMAFPITPVQPKAEPLPSGVLPIPHRKGSPQLLSRRLRTALPSHRRDSVPRGTFGLLRPHAMRHHR